MDRSRNAKPKAQLMSLPVLILIGIAAAHWLAPAEAQLGGHAQVTRLELRQTIGDGGLDARFHLASGLAVDQRIDDGAEADRLLLAAQAFATGKARMTARVESNKVVAWTLSVP